MRIDRRRYVAALAVLSMGAMPALAAPVSADSLPDGPWGKAKIGTTISYRVNQYQPMPGWLAGQRASSVSWKSDEVRFELLEAKP